jgi:hypothetical protein
MRSLYFTLECQQVVPCTDPGAMLIRLASPDWCVGQTQVGPWQVVTEFLGMDWNYGRGRPALFETVVLFNGRLLGLHARYDTWEKAAAGHARAVAQVRVLFPTR